MDDDEYYKLPRNDRIISSGLEQDIACLDTIYVRSSELAKQTYLPAAESNKHLITFLRVSKYIIFGTFRQKERSDPRPLLETLCSDDESRDEV